MFREVKCIFSKKEKKKKKGNNVALDLVIFSLFLKHA